MIYSGVPGGLGRHHFPKKIGLADSTVFLLISLPAWKTPDTISRPADSTAFLLISLQACKTPCRFTRLSVD